MAQWIIRPGVVVDSHREGLWRGRKFYELPPRTFRILLYLVEHANTVVPHEALLHVGWPDEPRVAQDLYRHIRRIRRVIEAHPETPFYLVTRKGRGYMLFTHVGHSLSSDLSDRK